MIRFFSCSLEVPHVASFAFILLGKSFINTSLCKLYIRHNPHNLQSLMIIQKKIHFFFYISAVFILPIGYNWCNCCFVKTNSFETKRNSPETLLTTIFLQFSLWPISNKYNLATNFVINFPKCFVSQPWKRCSLLRQNQNLSSWGSWKGEFNS